MSTTEQWPPQLETVRAVGTGEVPHTWTVQYSDDTEIRVLGTPGCAPPSPTDQVTLSWPTRRGIASLSVVCVGAVDDVYLLAPVAPAQHDQRREYARARVALPVTLVVDGVAVSGTTLDISEGGLALSPVGEQLVIPATVRAVLDLDGQRVELAARVLRGDAVHDGQPAASPPRSGAVLALEFIDPAPVGSMLRRQVLAWQARARQLRQ